MLTNIPKPQFDQAAVEKAKEIILKAQNICMLAHEHPDGDALGSSFGLAFALEQLGKKCAVACADPAPDMLSFMPGIQSLVHHVPEDTDLIIALDAGELNRYGALYSNQQQLVDHTTKLNFDHHITSGGCGTVNIIDPSAAATGEVLTQFLLQAGLEISKTSAICLLTGIITDTRAFEFSSTTPRTLELSAELMRRGATPFEIVKPVYRMKPFEQIEQWKKILGTVQRAHKGQVIWADLTLEMQKDMLSGLDEGIASYLLDTTGVQICLYFKAQDESTTKLSIRTTEAVDATKIATHFGGGGHMRAAGCTIQYDLSRARKVVLDYVEELLSHQQ